MCTILADYHAYGASNVYTMAYGVFILS